MTVAHAKSFLSLYEILSIAQKANTYEYLREIFNFIIRKYILCVLIRIASCRRF